MEDISVKLDPPTKIVTFTIDNKNATITPEGQTDFDGVFTPHNEKTLQNYKILVEELEKEEMEKK